MDSKFNIKRYIKFSLASNIIFNNSIFAGCNKKGNKEGNNKGCSGKGNKENNNKGYSGKGNKPEENNITSNEETPNNEQPNEEQPNEETPKKETPNKKPDEKPKKETPKKDYKGEIDKLLKQLSNIEKNNNFLPEKNIAFNKTNLENKIKSIDSDEKVKNIRFELNNLESELNKNLNELKSDYNNRFQEITEGNKNLDLKLNINLAKKNIDNLDFDKNSSNINDVKNKLKDLEKQYFDQLTSKCNDLKTKYDNLVKDKENLKEGSTKELVKNECNLTDKDFEIKRYIDFNNLNEQINKISQLIKGDEDSLKEGFKNNYKKYSEINDALNLGINDFTEELSNKINNFKIAEFSNINTILEQIYKSITDKIKELNNNLQKEYNEIIDKIGFFNSTKKEDEKFNYTSITINIDENTEKAVYEKLVKDINDLKQSFINKLSELKSSYETKIKDLNTKLKDLGLDETNLIDNNILSNLTFDKLTNDTISNIEKSINDAESNYNTTVEKFREECTNSLEQVKTDCNDNDILKIETISNLITKIEENIKNIDNKTKKDDVDNLILKLKTKITEAKEEKKKKKEEEAKKEAEEEEKKKKEEEEKKKKDEEEKKKKDEEEKKKKDEEEKKKKDEEEEKKKKEEEEKKKKEEEEKKKKDEEENKKKDKEEEEEVKKKDEEEEKKKAEEEEKKKKKKEEEKKKKEEEEKKKELDSYLNTINNIISDEKHTIKSKDFKDLNNVDFINLLTKKLNITYNKNESEKHTIKQQKITKIDELYYFVRKGKSYFIISYVIENFKEGSTTFNRKVVLVTSNNVITIGYYTYNSFMPNSSLFLIYDSKKPCLQTKISFAKFISCIWATKNVDCEDLLMKFKAPDTTKYGKYNQDKNSFCFNLINKKVYYVNDKDKKINKEIPDTLNNFGTISERTTLI